MMKSDSFPYDLKKLLIILLFIGFFSYVIIIPWLGFYYDDWPFAWIAHRLGPMEFFDSFRSFRPFLGPYFFITTSILNGTPWIWHFFNFLVRISLSLVCFWSLTQVWPTHKKKAFWIAILFFVYPGFNQQWISMTHSNQGLLPHLFQIISIGLMAKSILSLTRQKLWFALSLISTFIGIFSTEYFISLELLRPIFIWVIYLQSHEKNKIRFIHTLKSWIPYLAILMANIIWLVAYQSSPAYESYRVTIFSQLISHPLPFIQTSISDFIDSFLLSAVEVWLRLFNQFRNPLNALSTILGLGTAAVTFVFLFLTIMRHGNKWLPDPISHQDEKKHWEVQALVIGGAGIVLGKLPSWAIGLPLSTEFPHDRLMMSVMFAGSIFIVGLIEWLIANDLKKTVFFLLMISLSVGHHFTVGNTYRRDWKMQQDFFRQLVWRAPGLEDGTIILTHELPHKYVTDKSLSAALNWIYDPENSSHDISYMLAFTKARLGTDFLPELNPDILINHPYRTMNFTSSLSRALVIYYPTNGCLRVLDPYFTNIAFFPDAPYQLTDAIFLSNIDTIKTGAFPVQLPDIFSSEGEVGWCFHFQKAELARQFNDWNAVLQLLDQVENRNLEARHPSEYLVFFEALLRSGEFERAQILLTDHLIINGAAVDGTCFTMERILQSAPPAHKSPIASIFQSIPCD